MVLTYHKFCLLEFSVKTRFNSQSESFCVNMFSNNVDLKHYNSNYRKPF